MKINISLIALLLSIISVRGLSLSGKYLEKEEDIHTLIEERIQLLDKENITIRQIYPDTIYDLSIRVRSQKDFDNISELISQAVRTHKNILIEIKEGNYFSKTDHILISGQNHPDCRLSIIGKGDVTIMATSANLRIDAKEYGKYAVIDKYVGKLVDPEDIFTDGDNPILLSVTDDSVNSGVKFVDVLFERINPDTKNDFRYRLKSNLLSDMSADECKNLWIWATHSWISSYEKIDSVVDGYIYLTANRDIEIYQCRLNTDYRSWKIMPRIKIINQKPSDHGIYIDKDGLTYLPNSHTSIYKCDKGSFLNIKNSVLQSVEVSGIKFVGGNAPIIDINRVTDYAYIHDCDFTSQQGLSIRLSTDNGFVVNNSFRNSKSGVITIPNNGYRKHVIFNNRFTNCGRRLFNQACIRTQADSVLISENSFYNNHIAAVSVGVWHGITPQGSIFSIIEDNVIYNDEDFLKDYKNNSLLDVSMLYVYTKNDNAIIRRNRLNGLRTLAAGNGIYLDDGAYNVSVYDNIVTGIDGKLFNIDSRKGIPEKAKSNAPAYCTNNFIAKNIVDGPIRFEIRDDISTAIYPESLYGKTIFLTKDGKGYKNNFEKVNTTNDEILKVENIDLIVEVTKEDYDSLVKNSTLVNMDFFNKWLKVWD